MKVRLIDANGIVHAEGVIENSKLMTISTIIKNDHYYSFSKIVNNSIVVFIETPPPYEVCEF